MSAYFVLTLPDARSAIQLELLQKDTSAQLYQLAVSVSGDLLQQNLISMGLVPEAFVVQHDELYLLPTASLPHFQQLQREVQLLVPQHVDNSARSGRWLSVLGWGAVTSVLAGGAGYSYYLSQQDDNSVSVAAPVAKNSSESQEKVGLLANQQIEQASNVCLLYTSPSPRDLSTSRMPSSA